jgi:hypothetical protein
MKSIKVNADYEAVLFGKKESLPLINQALEFLALFVDTRPLFSLKNYSEEYLQHVESFIGRKPVIKKSADFENWWGELKDIELEKKLNSKEMSTKLNIEHGWSKDTHFMTQAEDLSVLRDDLKYLAKNPFGMSGQNFPWFPKMIHLNLIRLLSNLYSIGFMISPIMFFRMVKESAIRTLSIKDINIEELSSGTTPVLPVKI